MTNETLERPMDRLADLVADNGRLMSDLGLSRARIAAARAYLDTPGCNVRFGEAHLERCRCRHSRILASLRANRLESLRLLGDGGHDLG